MFVLLEADITYRIQFAIEYLRLNIISISSSCLLHPIL
jgi:hypothetical protein